MAPQSHVEKPETSLATLNNQNAARSLLAQSDAARHPQALNEGLQPSALNGGNIVDIFQRREESLASALEGLGFGVYRV